MKERKSLLIIIGVMAVAIVAMAIFIVYTLGNKDDAGSKAVETTTRATTEAATEEEVTEDDTEETTEKASSTNSDEKKLACSVKVEDAGNWQDGDKYVYQYNIRIDNKSKEDVSDWKVVIAGFKGGEIGDNWNGDYKISGDNLTITAVDYNGTIPKGGNIEMGLQVKYKSSNDAEKAATLYVGGEEYTELKEEPTTQSAEEKAESKKEKIEPESGTPLENHGKLSIDGTDVVDKDGKQYQLKGVSTHGLAWFPEYVNKDAFQTLRDEWGANVIRLAMYTSESGGYCQDGDKSKLKGLVEDGVEYATELGMYVIIDWHILHDTNPKDNQDEAVVFFDEMSAKYADYDNVLYEICNEPNGSTTWSDIKEYAETVIPVIRANDKDAIIIVGTPTWSQDVDQAADDPITGQDNIAYTTHFYAATHKDNIRSKVKTAHDKGLCVFISEFSICDASGNGAIDYDSAEDWFDMIDEYNLSYAGWSLCNKNETSALIDSGCSKTSGWSDSDLSDAGKWLKNQISTDD